MSIFQELPKDASKLREEVSAELYQNVLPFWTKHSPCPKGGFYSCLDEDGEIYDSRKFMWLNGRQMYIFATVCFEAGRKHLEEASNGQVTHMELVDQAKKAADFLLLHAFREEDGLVYFSLDAEGQPFHFERKIFSACFLCMGLAALSRHIELLENAKQYSVRSLDLLHSIIRLSHDPTPFGRPQCKGAPEASPLNVPMILLNVIDTLRQAGVLATDSSGNFDYEAEEEWCISEILKHVIKENQITLETVGKDGSILPGYDGRHMNPGHAIEAGWFVLSYAQRTGKTELKSIAADMVNWAFNAGWDKECEGLYYFLDSDGRSPPFLEWNMKLWWPHTEALVAFAMLYEETREHQYWEKLVTVWNYTIKHFSDAKGQGEWFGYLDRQGEITHRFKGGPYKGCFHVPRALFLVEGVLRRLEKEQERTPCLEHER